MVGSRAVLTGCAQALAKCTCMYTQKCIHTVTWRTHSEVQPTIAHIGLDADQDLPGLGTHLHQLYMLFSTQA